MSSDGGSGMVCIQCHQGSHADEAVFCYKCGGMLINEKQESVSSSLDTTTVHSSTAALLESLDGATRARLDFSTKLWDSSGIAFEKSRSSKHTAKSMAQFYAELGKIEKNYAASLAKLVSSPDFNVMIEQNELKSPPAPQVMVSTLIRAWAAIKQDTLLRSRSHATFAEMLQMRVETPLMELGKLLSAQKAKLETGVNESGAELKKATETHAKLKAKHEKMQMDYNMKGSASKITQQDLSNSIDAQAMAQVTEYQAQNAYYRVLSENLSKLAELEVERLVASRRILLAHRVVQSEMERKYLKAENDTFKAVDTIDPITEVATWLDLHQTRAPCPWASTKPVTHTGSASPGAPAIDRGTRPTSSSMLIASAAAVANANSAAVAASASTAAVAAASVAVGASSTSARSGPRKSRSSRPGSKDLSHDISSEYNSTPMVAALTITPSTAASCLPKNITLKDLPFPTINRSKCMEILPTFQWSPSMRALFPNEDAAALPDISSLALSDKDYNRMVYEQLLLSTGLLQDLSKKDHSDTILNIVRVQFHLPQSEHDLLVRVLSSDSSPATPSSSPSEAKILASESMGYVNYRLNLLKSLKSSKFPNLQLYAAWFKRQVHAIWLSIIWTMQMQVNAAVVSPSATSSTRSSTSATSSIPLSRFKRLLQIVQALGVSLTSKIDMKLFALGDSIAEQHVDLAASLNELDATLKVFPPPYTSVVVESLQYPSLLLNKIYEHLIFLGCITDGDDAGKPVPKDPPGSESEEDEDEDEDEGEEETIGLHDSYSTIIASLSSLRSQWKISELHHQYAQLRLVFHLIYYQSLEFDGRMLDADCLSREGDECVLPLLASISTTLTTSSHIKPEALDDEQLQFVCYTLRTLAVGLSEFQKFHTGPVTICLQFYTEISFWLGVKDLLQRLEAVLKMSAVNFYQSLIPTEQTLTIPDNKRGSASKSRSRSPTPTHGNPFGASSSSTASSSHHLPPAQILQTPKKIASWTPDEWKKFTKQMVAFIRDQIEEFHLKKWMKNKALQSVLGTKKTSSSTAEEEKGGKSSNKPNGAEICILQLLKCFQYDVQLLISERAEFNLGMDDQLIALISCLVRIQNAIMDPNYTDFWSSDSVKKELSSNVPNLSTLCSTSMKRWLEVQKGKVEGIRERCVSLDSWSAVDVDSGHKYSHSVKDLLNFLETIHDAFWVHSKSMIGYGVSESLPILIDLFNTTLVQYGAQIVQSAGLDMIPACFPTKEVKLKQAKESPDNKDKAKAFMKNLFKKDEVKEEPDESHHPAPLELPKRGLVAQNIQTLCVRLCCIENAIVSKNRFITPTQVPTETSKELSTSLSNHIDSFIDECPIIAPLSGKPSKEDQFLQERWSSWSGYFSPPTRIAKFDHSTMFTKTIDQMKQQIETLSQATGIYLVYVDWRASWLHQLYQPMPLESNRYTNGALETKVEESMPIVHQALTGPLFPLVAKHILTQLLSCVQYVLLYGRRSIQEDQVKGIVRSDVSDIIAAFSKVVVEPHLTQVTKEIFQLLSLMELPTDDLISQYQTQSCALPLPVLARIIAARSGKNAGKLIDKIRGK